MILQDCARGKNEERVQRFHRSKQMSAVNYSFSKCCDLIQFCTYTIKKNCRFDMIITKILHYRWEQYSFFSIFLFICLQSSPLSLNSPICRHTQIDLSNSPKKRKKKCLNICNAGHFSSFTWSILTVMFPFCTSFTGGR